MNHEWWLTFSAHFLAIVLGGLKVVLISWLIFYFVPKKYLGKFVSGFMKDLMSQINPADLQFASAKVAAMEPVAQGIVTQEDGIREEGLWKDYVAIPMEEVQPYVRELTELKPKTNAEIVALAGKHGFCFDPMGRLIRKPVS